MPLGFPVPDFRPAPGEPCFCRSGRPFGNCCGSTAPDRALPGGVQVFPEFLDAATCRKWVGRLERQPRERAMVTDANAGPGRPAVTRADPGRVCYEVRPGVLRRRIDDTVRAGFAAGARKAGRALSWFEQPTILRYEPGGFYHRHADSCQVVGPAVAGGHAWHKVRDRDLSLLLYLNDDYTGGGLTFVHFHFHYRPRIGDLLVFPSDNRYEHRAEKVRSGFRYAVVSWAAFEGARRVFAAPPSNAIPFT